MFHKNTSQLHHQNLYYKSNSASAFSHHCHHIMSSADDSDLFLFSGGEAFNSYEGPDDSNSESETLTQIEGMKHSMASRKKHKTKTVRNTAMAPKKGNQEEVVCHKRCLSSIRTESNSGLYSWWAFACSKGLHGPWEHPVLQNMQPTRRLKNSGMKWALFLKNWLSIWFKWTNPILSLLPSKLVMVLSLSIIVGHSDCSQLFTSLQASYTTILTHQEKWMMTNWWIYTISGCKKSVLHAHILIRKIYQRHSAWKWRLIILEQTSKIWNRFSSWWFETSNKAPQFTLQEQCIRFTRQHFW